MVTALIVSKRIEDGLDIASAIPMNSVDDSYGSKGKDSLEDELERGDCAKTAAVNGQN